MNRKLAIFAAAVAAFAVTCQAANAGARKEIDPRITTTSWIVGGAATAGYFAFNDWRVGGSWHNASGVSRAGAWGITSFACAAISPMVATVVLKRPLKYREAHILIGSCIVPIVGGWLVNEAYNAHWLWAPDEQAPKKVVHRRKRKIIGARAHYSRISPVPMENRRRRFRFCDDSAPYARLAMNRPSHRRKVSSGPAPFGSSVAFTSGVSCASIARSKACMLASWRPAQLLNSICL